MRTKTKRTTLAVVIGIFALLGGIAMAGAFDDVDETRFYAESVQWADDKGITEGTSATTFEPDRPLTRGEGVTMLHRSSQAITGEMHFEVIRVMLDAGETAEVIKVDGVSLSFQCYGGVWVDPTTGETDEDYDSPVDVGLHGWWSSTDDGWYGIGMSYGPGDSDGSSGADDDLWQIHVSTGDDEEPGDQVHGQRIDQSAIVTPNGGYIGVDGETTGYILKSDVRDNDCEYWGMVQWAEPPEIND